MERVFTEPHGRFEAGDKKDYPMQTWNNVAQTIGKPLESFTVTADQAAEEFAETRGTQPRRTLKRGRPKKV